jgi:hypothetical protein
LEIKQCLSESVSAQAKADPNSSLARHEVCQQTHEDNEIDPCHLQSAEHNRNQKEAPKALSYELAIELSQ